MIKRIFKAVGAVFAGIRNFFTPPPPPPVIHTNYCVHCGYEHPEEYLTKKTVKKEYEYGKHSIYYLYLCPDCVLIDPKLHHANIDNSCMVHYFWEDGEGNVYEFYQFKKCVHCNFEYPRDYMTKKTIKNEHGYGYLIYPLYLCPACVLIDPKFHHAEVTGGSRARYFWEDDEGKIYEFYEFKKNGNGQKYPKQN